MKKVIAKYLPVESEIRERDRLIIDKGKETHLRLFAVTQDIEVRDKYWNHKTGTIQNRTVGTDNESYKDFFKVLGELSSNATWVKEGDEIEIELERKWNYSKLQQEVVAAVKCSTCNTYH